MARPALSAIIDAYLQAYGNKADSVSKGSIGIPQHPQANRFISALIRRWHNPKCVENLKCIALPDLYRAFAHPAPEPRVSRGLTSTKKGLERPGFLLLTFQTGVQ